MTIKEIEAKSGMARANIRFYEAEGLLVPARLANGYRDYSEEDLQILKKIRLLRSLHISLEEIKALHAGKQKLSEILDGQIARLSSEKDELERAREVCQAMRNDDVCYQTLDAQYYLKTIHYMDTAQGLESDIIPEVYAPWRRCFSRWMDYVIYSLLWICFELLVLDINISIRSQTGCLPDFLVPLLLMLVLEPLQLSLFETTAGKWILGLYITDSTGGRLTYQNAFTRTWQVLLYGCGLGIPIYSLLRLWKSFKRSDAGETLEWEYRSAIVLKDKSPWRTAAYIGVHILLFCLLLFSVQAAQMPPNRGDITVRQFGENYNHFSRWYAVGTGSRMNDQGYLERIANSENKVIIEMDEETLPFFCFSEKDGIMAGMRFEIKLQGDNGCIYGHKEERILSVLAFVSAQGNDPFFSDGVTELIRTIERSPFDSFDLSVNGVRIICDICQSGYRTDHVTGALIPEDGADCSYSMIFSMQKE